MLHSFRAGSKLREEFAQVKQFGTGPRNDGDAGFRVAATDL
jgi:hypothetical protein